MRRCVFTKTRLAIPVSGLPITKLLLLLMGLGMIAALVACGGSSHTTTTPPPPPPTITVALSSTPTTLYVNDVISVTATVTGDSTNAGVNWTCAPSSSCGKFSANSSKSGTAVQYQAPATVPSGKVTLTATSAASSSASKSSSGITIQSFTLSAGNYVFSVRGTDTHTANSAYVLAGVFTTDGNGNIVTATGNTSPGEFAYSDFTYYSHVENLTGGSIAPSPSKDGTLVITLTSGDTVIGSPTGTITLNASMVSSSKALLIENDTWASGSGELDFQNTSTPLTTPSGAYVFYATGRDPRGAAGEPMSLGGVINVDGAGTISGAGSIFDINDAGASGCPNSCTGQAYPNQTFSASTVTSPDSFGQIAFNLNASCPVCGTGGTAIVLVGFMIDQNHIMLVENQAGDTLTGSPTGGMAIAQTIPPAGFASYVAGQTYAFGASGAATTNGTTTAPLPLQAAGLLTFNSGGLMGGNVSFNDISAQNAQGGTAIAAGSYTVDSTGRVTVTGVTDSTTTPTFTYNLQLYLTGEGHAFVISMDSGATAPDVLAGTSALQSGTLGASSLSGSYALNLSDFVVTSTPAEVEADAVGAFYADGSSNIFGFQNINTTLAGGGPATAPIQFQNTFTAGSGNGVIKVNGKTHGVAVPYTAYLIDATQGYVIENDASQLTLGYVQQH
jgi:hypothetical protein